MIRDLHDLLKAYKLQGRTKVHGLPVSVENRRGSVRRWEHPDGRPGKTKMVVPYGYVRGTVGADGDALDCYVGPDGESDLVFVVNQVAPHENYAFDEHKILFGFLTLEAARNAYLAHADPAMLGSMTEMSVDDFKLWVSSGKLRRPLPTTALELLQPPAPQPKFVVKKAGPYIGPRGGKWADPQHTIPWRAETGRGRRRPPDLEDGYGGPIRRGMNLAEAEDAIRDLESEHSVVFGSDGQQLHRQRGTGASCPVTDEAKQRMLADENAVFTHNHPGGLNLSVEDIHVAVGLELKEMRAVGPGGTVFSLSRPPGGWNVPDEHRVVGASGFSLFTSRLVEAREAGVSKALDRMDKRIIDAGGRAGDSDHPAFSLEVWSGYVTEETHKSLNEGLRRWYGLEVRRTVRRAAPGREAGDDAPRPEPRRPVRGGGGPAGGVREGGPGRLVARKSQLYIGPRGGKWADPGHTVPWHPDKPRLRARVGDLPEVAPGTALAALESGAKVDDALKTRLLVEFDPLVRSQARRAQRLFGLRDEFSTEGGVTTNLTLQDLRVAGVEGLLRAVQAYRPGGSFAALAKMHVRDQARLHAATQRGMSLPRRHARALGGFVAARARARRAERVLDPSAAQVAKHWEIRLSDLHDGGGAGRIPEGSYEYGGRSHPGRVEMVREFGELLSAEKGASGSEVLEVLGEEGGAEEALTVHDALEQLRARIRSMEVVAGEGRRRVRYRADGMGILLMRHGVGRDSPASVSEVAKEVPIERRTSEGWERLGDRQSRAMVAKFEAAAMKRAKEVLEVDDTVDVLDLKKGTVQRSHLRAVRPDLTPELQLLYDIYRFPLTMELRLRQTR